MIFMENIDSTPYTGVRNVKGKLKLKEKTELKKYGYTNKILDEVAEEHHLTYGNVYDVIKVEGFGDCEDAFVLNDFGDVVELADLFFDEVDENKLYWKVIV